MPWYILAEFLRDVDIQIYLNSSAIRKTAINLNLSKHVKNPLFPILLFITFTFSVVVKLLFSFSVTKFLIQCHQERLKRIITSIFVIGKFDFQISVSIRKAKVYFPISPLWYVIVGFMQKIRSIFRVANVQINLIITLLVILRISFFLRKDILWSGVF